MGQGWNILRGALCSRGYDRGSSHRKRRRHTSWSEVQTYPILVCLIVTRTPRPSLISCRALGGAIGTGLFVGSGGILALVGPAPLFMAYLSMMMVVWCVMNNLAEITTYLPMKGITIPYFVKRYVDSSLAFALGWNYW
jgi:amino acid permease